MVVIKEIINKKTNEPYKTKNGDILKDYVLELGDIFVIAINKIFENKNVIEKNGKKEVITNYSIKIHELKDKNGNKHNDFFVSLTPAQAKSIKNVLQSSGSIVNKLFHTYNYDIKEVIDGEEIINTYLGVGLNNFEKPKSIEELENL